MNRIDLPVKFCGIDFINPFLLAASPPSDSREMTARSFDAGWAGAVLKTVSPIGNKTPLRYPMMSSLNPGGNMIGLHNIDLYSDKLYEEWMADIAWLKQRFPDHRILLNIVGDTRDEWTTLVQKAEQAGADLIEAGISCPQGTVIEGEEKSDGWMVSQDARLTEKVTRWTVESAKSIPILVKITSLVTDITSIARAVERGGAQGVCVIDSVEGIVGVDLGNYSPLPSVHGKGTHGGFTGRAIKPIALRCVADVASSINIQVSGVGGIYTWQDAVEFFLMGATTLQVCTAIMHKGFGIIDHFLDGVSRYLDSKQISSVSEIIGLGLSNIKSIEDLEIDTSVKSTINKDLCVNCGLCYVACRDGGHMAIDFDLERNVTIIEQKCVGCGLCAQVCPVPDCIAIESTSVG